VTPPAEAALTSAPPSKRARTLVRRPVRDASWRAELAPERAPATWAERMRRAVKVALMAFLLSPYISYSKALNRFLKALS
jgi:hypothetical protein